MLVLGSDLDGWFGVVATASVTSTVEATSSPVSTGIGDRLWRVYRCGIFHRPLSLAIPSCSDGRRLLYSDCNAFAFVHFKIVTMMMMTTTTICVCVCV